MTASVVEYSISLRDMFSAIAEKIDAVVRGLNKTMGGLGTAATEAQTALNSLKVPPGFGAITSAAKEASASVAGIGRAAREAKPLLDGVANNKAFLAGGSRIGIGRDEVPGRGGGFLPRGMSTGVGLLALSGLGRNEVLEKNIEFDEQMRLLRSVAVGATGKQIEAMRNSIFGISSGSIFSPTEIAKAFHDMAIRGMPLEQIPTIVKQVMGLAAGTGEEIGKTAGVHLDILRQYGLPVDAGHIRHVSDVLGAAQLSTGSTLENLKEAYKMAGPAASLFGLSMEDTAVLAGGLSLKGIRGSLSGTGLRRAFTGLEKWNTKSEPLWEGAGFEKGDFVDFKTGKLKDVLSILQQLHDKITPEKMAAMGMTPMEFFMRQFGDRAGPVVAALVSNLDKLKDIRENLKHVDGLAERMGDAGGKGLSAAMKQLASAWEGLDLAIGKSGFNEQIEKMTRWFNDLLKYLSQSNPHLLQFIGYVAMAGAVLSAMALPLIAITMLAPAIASVAGAASLLAGVTGIGAALFIGYEVVQNWDKIAAAVERVNSALAALKTGDWSGLKSIGKDVAGFIGGKEEGKPQDWGLVGQFYDWLRSKAAASPATEGGYLGGLSDAAKNLMASGAQRILIEMPHSIEINSNVKVDGVVQGEGRGTATLPLNAITSQGEHAPSAGAPVAPGGR